jgi:hypothetical protein
MRHPIYQRCIICVHENVVSLNGADTDKY